MDSIDGIRTKLNKVHKYAIKGLSVIEIGVRSVVRMLQHIETEKSTTRSRRLLLVVFGTNILKDALQKIKNVVLSEDEQSQMEQNKLRQVTGAVGTEDTEDTEESEVYDDSWHQNV